MATSRRPEDRPASGRRTARLEARVTVEERELLLAAAELTGRGLSEFVVSAARHAAEEELRRRNTVRLSTRDAIAFVDALMNPGAPTQELRRAARRYREEMVRRGSA